MACTSFEMTGKHVKIRLTDFLFTVSPVESHPPADHCDQGVYYFRRRR